MSTGHNGRVTTFRKRALLATVVILSVGTLVARLFGYKVGGSTVVRCRHGHLFTTIWIPGASLKAVRLGWARFQRCPVGKHWSLVTPVNVAKLSEEEREFAVSRRDTRLP